MVVCADVLVIIYPSPGLRETTFPCGQLGASSSPPTDVLTQQPCPEFMVFMSTPRFLFTLDQKLLKGISLVVQWLRLCAPNAGGPGSIPDQGTRSHMHAATRSLHVATGEPVCRNSGALEPQLRSLPAVTKTRCNRKY